MRVAHILVCHSVSPEKLLSSIPNDPTAVWLVFTHSKNEEIKNVARSFLAQRSGELFDYGVNRGLAKSWNEGILSAHKFGVDAIALMNDDLFFYPDGYCEFVNQASILLNSDSDLFMVDVLGLESGGSPLRGQVHCQGFSCCIIPNSTFERVGYFDQNFYPAYFEDCDFRRRCQLMQMTSATAVGVLSEHERSKTIRTITDHERSIFANAYAQSNAYYERKWGGPLHHERYDHPFDAGFNLKIDAGQVEAPYGVEFDR